MMKKLKMLGNIITILALGLVFFKLFSLDLDFDLFLNKTTIWILILCIIIYTLLVMVFFIPWINVVSIFVSEKIEKKLVMYIYTKSNILKYVPGNVFQYIGRNELALKLNLNHVDIAFSSLIEIVLILAAALFVSALFIWRSTIVFILEYKQSFLFLFLVGIAAVVGLGFILVRFYFDKLKSYYQKYNNILLKKANIKRLVLSFLFYVVQFFINALIFILLLYCCGKFSLSIDSLKIIVGSFVLSWVIGYITPGAPGGLGVREAVMISIMNGRGGIDGDFIILAMVLYRAINIIGDSLGFGISFFIYSRKKKET